MNKNLSLRLCLLLPVSALSMVSAPAFAQAADDDVKINQLIIYGDDICPKSSADEIVVCAKLDEAERYRIPTPLRDDPNDIRKEAWTQKVKAYEYVGDTGTMSCTPVGAGGFTGCGLKAIDAAYAESGKDPAVSFGRLIAAERKKRLASIDAEAEAVEERTKAFEADRLAREAREEEARRRVAEQDAAEEAEGELPQPK